MRSELAFHPPELSKWEKEENKKSSNKLHCKRLQAMKKREKYAAVSVASCERNGNWLNLQHFHAIAAIDDVVKINEWLKCLSWHADCRRW